MKRHISALFCSFAVLYATSCSDGAALAAAEKAATEKAAAAKAAAEKAAIEKAAADKAAAERAAAEAAAAEKAAAEKAAAEAAAAEKAAPLMKRLYGHWIVDLSTVKPVNIPALGPAKNAELKKRALEAARFLNIDLDETEFALVGGRLADVRWNYSIKSSDSESAILDLKCVPNQLRDCEDDQDVTLRLDGRRLHVSTWEAAMIRGK